MIRRAAQGLAWVAAVSLLSPSGCGKDGPDKPPEKPPHVKPTPEEQAEPLPESVTTGGGGGESDEAAPSPGGEDAEPNDSPSEALPLVPGTAVTGRVHPPKDDKARDGDEDWYVIDVPGEQPALARVELKGPDDLDVVLEWMKVPERGKPRRIVQADVVRKEPGDEVLAALALPPGKAYFRVREAWYRGKKRTGSPGSYTLKATLAELKPGVDAEPNDDPAYAIPLAFGVLGSGTIGHWSDVDAWKIPLPQGVRGKQLRVAIGGVQGLQIMGTLTWEGRDVPLGHGKSREGEPLYFRNIAVPEFGAEALIVSVGARRGAAVDTEYTVRVTAEPAAEGRVEAEPNDTRRTPTMLDPAADPRVYGYIDQPNDKDRFAFDVEDVTGVDVKLSPPLEADLTLELIGPDEQSRRLVNAGGAGQFEILRGFGLTKGRWQIVVAGHDGSHDPSRAYALDVQLGRREGEELEPNDQHTDPFVGALAPGKTVSGWVHPAKDRDWWKVDLTAAPSGRIATVKLKTPPGVAMKVGIYDEQATMLTTSERIAGEGTVTHFLQPGAYYVRVWPVDDDAVNPETPYQLTLLE